MKIFCAVPLIALCLATSASAQLLPAFATVWMEEYDVHATIARSAQKMQMERWKIQQDIQTKIFETTQDITVNANKKTLFKEWANDGYKSYINDGTTIDTPQLQFSGRVNVAPSSGVIPPPSQAPLISYTMQVLLFRVPTTPSASPDTLLWTSDALTTQTFTGFGTFDYDLSFTDPNFSATFAPGEQIGVQTIFTADIDTTSMPNDNVDISLSTGGDPYNPDLPETGFSLHVVEVPEPACLGVALASVGAARRKRR